jgi:hypothetical protein
VRIVRRVAKPLSDGRLELVGERMLEQLRLLVHAIPGQVEGLRQEQLQQPVAAQRTKGHAATGGGEPHAVIGGVRREPQLVEALDHRGRRARRDAEPLGELVVAHWLVAAALEGVDRLRVVLNDRREFRLRFYLH